MNSWQAPQTPNGGHPESDCYPELPVSESSASALLMSATRPVICVTLTNAKSDEAPLHPEKLKVD